MPWARGLEDGVRFTNPPDASALLDQTVALQDDVDHGDCRQHRVDDRAQRQVMDTLHAPAGILATRL